MDATTERSFPFPAWLPGYNRSALVKDLIAGMSVGVVLVPQSMAYAVLAGVPPVYGLYASLVPLLIYPFFGTSRHLAVGIMAIDCLIVAAGVGAMAPSGSGDYITLVLLLAVMTGIIQIVMGLLRFGFMVALLSRPVIMGFTSGAALTIVASQLRYLMGVPLPSSTHLPVLLWSLLGHLGAVHLPTLLLGCAALAVLLLMGRTAPKIPGSLFVILLGGLAVVVLNLDAVGVSVTGPIPSHLPQFGLRLVSAETVLTLLPTAITLSLIQFMTVVSLGKTFALRHRYVIDSNRELIAAGMDNLVGGLFGSVPVSGSFSRSAITERSGGMTSLSNTFAAALVLVTILFLTPYFSRLPMAVFAAIIMVAAVRLIDLRELKFLLRTKRVDGLIAVVTFLSTLVLGIQTGILTGITASVIGVMFRVSRPRVSELGWSEISQSFSDIERDADASRIHDALVFRVEASFTFVNAEYIRDLVLGRIASVSPAFVLLDAASINDIDTTALSVLDELCDVLERHNIELFVCGLNDTVLDILKVSGLFERISSDRILPNARLAMQYVSRASDKPAIA